MVELGPVNKFLAPNPYIGNNLFHYCWGREIANKKGYYLKTKKIEGFPSTYNDIPGKIVLDNELVTPSATQIFDMEKIYNHPGKIFISGYPQRYEFYSFNKKNIKEWLFIENEDQYESPNDDDIVMHIRLGDYTNYGWQMPIEYYQSILEIEKYKNAYIITDDPNRPELKKLIDDGCIIKDNSRFGSMQHMADFVFAKKSTRLILSPSTFSWWAGFLGDGIVYFPCVKYPWIADPKKDDIDLRVFDDSRYKFVYLEQ